MYSGGIGIYYLNITPQSEGGTPKAKPYMPHTMFSHNESPLLQGTFSPSWAHLPFHRHIFPFMVASSLSWANLNMHPFVLIIPANLNMHQQTESEAKAKAKAKPNMMIICSCKPCLAHAIPRRLSNHLLRLSSPLQLKAWTASVP